MLVSLDTEINCIQLLQLCISSHKDNGCGEDSKPPLHLASTIWLMQGWIEILCSSSLVKIKTLRLILFASTLINFSIAIRIDLFVRPKKPMTVHKKSLLINPYRINLLSLNATKYPVETSIDLHNTFTRIMLPFFFFLSNKKTFKTTLTTHKEKFVPKEQRYLISKPPSKYQIDFFP